LNLGGILSIASSGLANINAELGVVSHNVANANTTGYAAESTTQEELTADGVGMGVWTGPTTRVTDDQLQTDVNTQNSSVAGLQTQQAALQAIDAVQGTPGDGTDLASLLGKLQNQFSTLLESPDSPTQQQEVVSAAQTLASSINTMSATYGDQRQNAEDNIVSEVTSINSALSSLGSLSDQIMQVKAAGQSTADLENQRDAVVSSLSQLVGVKTLEQPNGDLLVMTTGGTTLPIHDGGNALSVTGSTVGPASYYPGGGISGITLGGIDVTGELTGGSLGANITLRDSALPTYQAELDEFSQNLASRFQAQGLTLFSDANGAVPSGGGSPAQSGYVGFSSEIQVNPAVLANPSLVRDGTNSVSGSPTGASAFTPNPSNGPAGFTTLIQRVLDYALGTQVQAGVAQPASNSSGLGPAGTLSAPYAGGTGTALSDIATSLVASQSADSASVTSQLGTEQAVQTTLQSKLSSETGVNIDTEMSLMITLQNAYGANAKVMSAAQSMWSALLGTVS
jgi:flagellar hook-associated protein 1 FlgK